VIEAQEPVPTTNVRRWAEEGLKRQDELAWVRYVAMKPDADFDELVREITAPPDGHVRKRDGRLEVFDQQRLRTGIELVLGKRHENDEAFKKGLDVLVETIAREVRASRDPMPTETVVYRVLSWLRENDRLAFLSFLVAHVDCNVVQLADVLARWGFSVPAKPAGLTPLPG
jgi:transcriptional regulator NrdR family protein